MGSADDDTAMRAHFVARGNFRPGRWPDPHQVVAVTLLQSPNLALSDLDRQNASFIAASRDGISRLLAEGDRLLVRHQRTVETLRRVLPEITRQVGEHHATVASLRSLLSELESP